MELGRRLHFTGQRTMQTAQKLYEAGHITYMRTDSTTLSEQAVHSAVKVTQASRALLGATAALERSALHSSWPASAPRRRAI